MTGNSETALDLLHAKVRAFVRDKGWENLRPIQEKAIPIVLHTGDDLIVSAGTSSGKTEAAFLPLISKIMDTKATSFQVLYVGPLKALINDQFKRLSEMIKGTGVQVHRWHGDVDNHRKRALRNSPSGILQITPESIESSLINFGHQARQLYGSLDFMVIDELHAFLENERGMHLRSLLCRIAQITTRNPRFIALSATLADPAAAQKFLRPEYPGRVQVIEERSPRERDIHVRTFAFDSHEKANAKNKYPDALQRIAEDIHRLFQGSTNLIFANSRRTVEALATHLKEMADDEAEYRLHHGSLARQIRFATEAALKSEDTANAICTSTLELGIDVGHIEAIAQIDPTATVSALVQRVGRSGRREGQKSTLRLYIRRMLPDDPTLTELLAPELLQAIALIRLMERGWLEPPACDRFHLSTLVHQCLSLLKQYGGLTRETMYETLCQQGSFQKVSAEDFRKLLAGLKAHELITTDSEKYETLSLAGERITAAPDFYAAFATPIELLVRHGCEQIGKLPVVFGLREGDTILLDARRWQIESIDWKNKSIWVKPTRFGNPPVFLGQGGDIHTEVYKEMARVLRGNQAPRWLDSTSIEILADARTTARQTGLVERDIFASDNCVRWFPWIGTRALQTLRACAEFSGLESTVDALSIVYSCSVSQFREHLANLQNADPALLAALLPSAERERFDKFVDRDLLNRTNAVDHIDMPGAIQAARKAIRFLDRDHR